MHHLNSLHQKKPICDALELSEQIWDGFKPCLTKYGTVWNGQDVENKSFKEAGDCEKFGQRVGKGIEETIGHSISTVKTRANVGMHAYRKPPETLAWFWTVPDLNTVSVHVLLFWNSGCTGKIVPITATSILKMFNFIANCITSSGFVIKFCFRRELYSLCDEILFHYWKFRQ